MELSDRDKNLVSLAAQVALKAYRASMAGDVEFSDEHCQNLAVGSAYLVAEYFPEPSEEDNKKESEYIKEIVKLLGMSLKRLERSV